MQEAAEAEDRSRDRRLDRRLVKLQKKSHIKGNTSTLTLPAKNIRAGPYGANVLGLRSIAQTPPEWSKVSASWTIGIRSLTSKPPFFV